jgi:membrane associated rhomboid family serine protease
MFLPLSDTVPMRRLRGAYTTFSIIALNVAIFTLFQSGWVFDLGNKLNLGMGLIPSVVLGPDFVDGFHVPAWATPFTSLFLHGGLAHLLFNLLFLWIFADNVEDAMGHWMFLAFYLVCGALSGLAHAITVPASQSPLVGASGAISAVMGAYLVLHPRVNVFGLLLNVIPFVLRARWAIGAWIVFQIGHGLFDQDRGTAWFAHVGGFAAGALLVALFKAPEVPLFGRADRV